jgi:D-alanine transaminase
MSDQYFYDGRFVRGDEPVVSLGDRGYQFGDGVYDAWMVYGGRHFLRGEHLDRFECSCAAIGIAPSYSRHEVEAFTDEMLARSGIERGMVYLQWTRGLQLPRSHAPAPGLRSILSGYIKDLPPYPEEYFSRGVATVFHPDERQTFCDIKSLNLLGSVMANIAARAALCHEAILVREEGSLRFVTECSRSNCFAVRDGVIFTAPLGKLILSGVTRQVVLGLAKGLGIHVAEEFRSPEFFAEADEVFISAASGILPVATIDGAPVGRGATSAVGSRPRTVFSALEEGYRALIDANRGKEGEK